MTPKEKRQLEFILCRYEVGSASAHSPGTPLTEDEIAGALVILIQHALAEEHRFARAAIKTNNISSGSILG